MTPDLLLRAYAMGIFPMADSRDDPQIRWIEPRLRGVMPLDGFRMSRSLRRSLLRSDYEVTVDRDFDATVAACAAREETWISHRIQTLYSHLHAQGHAHSVEVRADGKLVGGTYGVVLGGAFFGESMFSRRTDASKIALAWLVHRLRSGGFRLFDTQFLTDHLARMGGMEMPQDTYISLLETAIPVNATFSPAGYSPTAPDVVHALAQLRTQTS